MASRETRGKQKGIQQAPAALFSTGRRFLRSLPQRSAPQGPSHLFSKALRLEKGLPSDPQTGFAFRPDPMVNRLSLKQFGAEQRHVVAAQALGPGWVRRQGTSAQ